MSFNHLRFAVLTGAAAALVLSGSAIPAQEDAPTRPLLSWAGSGTVRLPKNRVYFLNFYVTERKGNTFTGRIVYDLGLREQAFAVTGKIDPQGRVTFTEEGGPENALKSLSEGKRPSWALHPHSPVSGGGKFEGTMHRKVLKGVAQLYLVGKNSREPVPCTFELELIAPLTPTRDK